MMLEQCGRRNSLSSREFALGGVAHYGKSGFFPPVPRRGLPESVEGRQLRIGVDSPAMADFALGMVAEHLRSINRLLELLIERRGSEEVREVMRRLASRELTPDAAIALLEALNERDALATREH
jgi:hypothetical protein